MNERIKEVQEEIRQLPEIVRKSACLTGSSLLYKDFDVESWGSDVDIFVYNNSAFLSLITYLAYVKEWKLGETEAEEPQNELKLSWYLADRWRWSSWGLATMYFRHPNGIQVNISTYRNTDTAAGIISSFDMTNIMIAEDLYSGEILDMRGDDIAVCKPNPWKRISYSSYSIKRWLRQAERIYKYEERGFDVSPMRKFYIDLMKGGIEQASYWTKMKSTEELEEAKLLTEGYKEVLNKLDRELKLDEESTQKYTGG